MLRRRVFDLEERLMSKGERVRGQPSHDWCPSYPGSKPFEGKLEMKIVGPKEFVCGKRPHLMIEVRNLTDGKVRLCLWALAWQLVHLSGNIPKMPPTAAAGPPPPPPGPEDYDVIGAGERVKKTFPFPYVYHLLMPGMYHASITYWPREEGRKALGIKERGSLYLTSDVARIRGVEADEVGGLRFVTSADVTSVEVGEPLTFAATLRNTSKKEYFAVAKPWVRPFTFRDTATGEEKYLWPSKSTRPDPQDGHNPHYRRKSDYTRLAPGKETGTRIVLAPADIARAGDFIRPGRSYEVTAHYLNDKNWFIEDGRVLGWYAWLGRLASKPVTVTFKAAEHGAGN